MASSSSRSRPVIYVVGRPGETLAGLMIDDEWVALASDRFDRPDYSGSAFVGRLRKFDAALNGWFVDLGFDRDGLLPLSRFRPDQRKGLVEGQLISGGITAMEREGKGLRLTVSVDPLASAAQRDVGLSFNARNPIGKLSDLLGPTDPEVLFDRAETRTEGGATKRSGLIPAKSLHPGSLRQAWRDLISPTVQFEGGLLTFELTRAGWMVDIDLSNPNDLVADNARALCRLVSEITLRNLTGLIVVDCVGLTSRKDRTETLARFEAALSQQKEVLPVLVTHHTVIDEFGCLRITRQRRYRSVTEQQMSRAEEPETGWRVDATMRAIDAADDVYISENRSVRLERPADEPTYEEFRRFFGARNIKVEWT